MDPGSEDLTQLVSMAPFAAVLGIEIAAATADEVVGRLRWREELCTVGGVLHGGALIALADHLEAVCALLNLPHGAGTATITSSTNFLLPVRGGEVTAISRPLRVGRSVVTVQTELRDGEGRLVAQVTQAQADPSVPSSPSTPLTKSAPNKTNRYEWCGDYLRPPNPRHVSRPGSGQAAPAVSTQIDFRQMGRAPPAPPAEARPARRPAPAPPPTPRRTLRSTPRKEKHP